MRTMSSACCHHDMEISEQVRPLVTRRGFVRAFWRELRRRRGEDPRVTQEDTYNELEDLYRETFGEPQFPSFDAFRMWRDRRR